MNEQVKPHERYTVSIGGSSQYFLCTTDGKQPSVSLVGVGTLMQTEDHDRDIKARDGRIAELENERAVMPINYAAFQEVEAKNAEQTETIKALEKAMKLGAVLANTTYKIHENTIAEQAETITRLREALVQHIARGGTKENDDLKRVLDTDDISWATFGAYQMSPLTEGEK